MELAGALLLLVLASGLRATTLTAFLFGGLAAAIEIFVLYLVLN